MARKIPPPPSLALDILRTREGWTQKELAEATGISANLISDYERGRKKLSRERLDSLVEVMGLQPAKAVSSAMRFLQEGEVRADPNPPSPESQYIEAVAAESGRLMSGFTRSLLTLLTSQGQALEARQQARALWVRLKRRDPAQRRALVEKVAEFRNWALCELLCEESIKAAGDSADRALELAGLALRVAELVPGEEAWRRRLQGYAWAHVGNAWRVKSDLPAADEAFVRSRQLWRDVDSGLLEEAKVLDLEASLRREQSRFNECLELLDLALTADRGNLRKHLLINKANALLAAGSFETAIEVLRQATPLVDNENESRLLFALKFNLAANLSFLGRHQEAALMLPSLGALAAKIGNEIDLVRLHWLEARMMAGVGQERAGDHQSLERQGRLCFPRHCLRHGAGLPWSCRSFIWKITESPRFGRWPGRWLQFSEPKASIERRWLRSGSSVTRWSGRPSRSSSSESWLDISCKHNTTPRFNSRSTARAFLGKRPSLLVELRPLMSRKAMAVRIDQASSIRGRLRFREASVRRARAEIVLRRWRFGKVSAIGVRRANLLLPKAHDSVP